MSRRSSIGFRWFCAVVLCAVTAATASAQRPADFGKQWIRNNPFTIAALAQQSSKVDGPTYKGAGFSNFLAWKNPATLLPIAAGNGLPWHFSVNEDTLTQAVMDEVAFAAGHLGGTGWLVNDEPVFLDMAGTVGIIDYLKLNHPEDLIYTNAFPIGAPAEEYYGDTSNPGYNYSQYLNDIATILEPDVMMYDFYPFGIGGTHSGFYYTNMMAVRNAAQANNLPYWAFIQAWEKPNPPFDKRLPSESDLRFQMFTLLAAGYTGFHYFAWDLGSLTAMVDPNGDPSALYAVAGPANAEVQILGNALRFLESTDVRYIRNTGNPAAPSISDWSAGAGGNTLLTHVAVDDTTGLWKDGLIGFFDDDQGEQYFMVVNAYHGENMSAAATALGFELGFDPSVTELLWLNRLTGEEEVLPLDGNNELHFTLPGGTGALFKYNTGIGFPGFIADPLLGDATNDGTVTADDLIAVQQNFGTVGAANGLLLGDASDNGAVDSSDLISVQQHFGDALGPAGGGAVPEPATAAIGLSGALAACRRRRGGGLGL